MSKKLDVKSFESQMMKEFADLRLIGDIILPQDPEKASYLGYRAGRLETLKKEQAEVESKLQEANS
jgi:hypothetical protein